MDSWATRLRDETPRRGRHMQMTCCWFRVSDPAAGTFSGSGLFVLYITAVLQVPRQAGRAAGQDDSRVTDEQGGAM